LNKLLELRNCSPNLKYRLRKYLDEAEHVYRQQYQRESISWLSAGLQGELAVESGVGEICSAVWYLRNLRGHVLIEIAQHFTAKMYCPGEHINDMFSLSVLIKGSCFQKGFIIVPFKVIAEDMILVTPILRESVFPRTLTFVEVMKLEKDDLMAICHRHPEFSHRIRKAQIKLAMWRGFIYAAKVKKAADKRTSTSSWEEMFVNSQRRSQNMLTLDQQAPHLHAAGCDPSEGRFHSSAAGGEMSIIRELHLLGQRFDEGMGDLRCRIDKLDMRVQLVEQRASFRPKVCRAM
jgi:hypothetical protein